MRCVPRLATCCGVCFCSAFRILLCRARARPTMVVRCVNHSLGVSFVGGGNHQQWGLESIFIQAVKRRGKTNWRRSSTIRFCAVTWAGRQLWKADSGQIRVHFLHGIGDRIRQSRVQHKGNSFGGEYLSHCRTQTGQSARTLFLEEQFGPVSGFFFAEVGIHAVRGLWAPYH